MTAVAKSPLKGLTERQLKLVQYLAAHPEVLLDFQRSTRYSARSKYNISLHVAPPRSRYEVGGEIARVLGVHSYGRWEGAFEVAANGLFTKNLLVQVAEVSPARKTEGGYSIHATNRYALTQGAIEAVGGVAEQLDAMRAREQAAVAREQAWLDARRPLDNQGNAIRRKLNSAKSEAVEALRDPTATRLIEIHTEYHKALAELNELNALLKVTADNHGRKYELYTERGY
jgi:hypothetical protein